MKLTRKNLCFELFVRKHKRGSNVKEIFVNTYKKAASALTDTRAYLNYQNITALQKEIAENKAKMQKATKKFKRLLTYINEKKQKEIDKLIYYYEFEKKRFEILKDNRAKLLNIKMNYKTLLNQKEIELRHIKEITKEDYNTQFEAFQTKLLKEINLLKNIEKEIKKDLTLQN